VTTIGMTNIGTAIAKAIGTDTEDTGNLSATTGTHLSKSDPLGLNGTDSRPFFWGMV
jgi:hypothetical protein